MKKVTIRYIPGLGDFLDERNIKWSHNDNTVTFEIDSIENAFLLGIKFKLFLNTIQSQDWENNS